MWAGRTRRVRVRVRVRVSVAVLVSVRNKAKTHSDRVCVRLWAKIIVTRKNEK